MPGLYSAVSGCYTVIFAGFVGSVGVSKYFTRRIACQSENRDSTEQNWPSVGAAHELQRAGLIPGTSAEWLEDARALDIMVGAPPASLAFDLPSGAVGYTIETRLVARQSGLILLDCKIATEWDAEIFLPTSDDRTPLRKLGWLQYSRSELLNDWTETPLRFHSRGQMFEGMILAMGFKPIPSAYRHGMLAPFELTFLDQHENEIRHEAELFVDRTAKGKSMVRPRTGLYDPHEAPESSEVVAHGDASLWLPLRPGESLEECRRS